MPVARSLLLLALLAGVASATESQDPKALARKHFNTGLAHYNLQEYKDAIPEFEAAYRLVPDAVILYNLAQAHRLADNPERAVYFYRAFLRSDPQAANRSEVEGRIATLEKLLQEKRNVAQPPDHALAADNQPQAVAPVETAASAPPKTSPLYKKWWLWTVVGVVAVGAGVGLGVGLSQRAQTFSAPLGTVGPSALGVK